MVQTLDCYMLWFRSYEILNEEADLSRTFHQDGLFCKTEKIRIAGDFDEIFKKHRIHSTKIIYEELNIFVHILYKSISIPNYSLSNFQ